jgi:RNA polymerase-associated protein RTF1
VRYCIGIDNGQSVYRICEIVNLVDTPKVYKVDEQNFNQNFVLKHGSSSKEWPMDRASNSRFEVVGPQPPGLWMVVHLWVQAEFEWLTKSAERDKVKLPTKKELNKKMEEMTKLSTAPVTEV